MRRAVAKLVQAGTLQRDAATPAALQAACGAVRNMGGAAGHGPAPETPLTKIMPPLVAMPRQVVGTALSLTGKLIVGAATSGAVKSAVTSFAEEVLMKEQFVKLNELDVACWTYWLSTAGYSSQAGYKKLAEAALSTLSQMEPQQVSSLVQGFHKANYYDKSLFDAVSTHVSANFTKYETEQLLPMLTAFSEFNHYSLALFDDIADSIAYANSYLAPLKAPTDQVCSAIAAFGKFGHERADVLVTLARGVSELGLGKLSKEARASSVVAALRGLHRFKFYPEQVDALLYFTESEADSFSADEQKLAQEVRSAVEAQTGGKLAVYKENPDEDAAHWYAHHAQNAPAHHELYVLRDALIPKSYSPAAFRGSK